MKEQKKYIQRKKIENGKILFDTNKTETSSEGTKALTKSVLLVKEQTLNKSGTISEGTKKHIQRKKIEI